VARVALDCGIIFNKFELGEPICSCFTVFLLLLRHAVTLIFDPLTLNIYSALGIGGLVLDLATPEGCKAELTWVVVISQDSLPAKYGREAGKRGTVKIAESENAGLENAAPNCRTGKRQKRHVWKAKWCTSHIVFSLL